MLQLDIQNQNQTKERWLLPAYHKVLREICEGNQVFIHPLFFLFLTFTFLISPKLKNLILSQ